MLDKLIVGARVIDGSGEPKKIETVGILNGKLVVDPKEREAREVIDAKGKVLCPGFIDAHSHGDRLIATEDGRLFKTVQGITTELAGNCGSSYSPIGGAFKEHILEAGLCDRFGDAPKEWNDFEDYLRYAETHDLSANARFYVGHGMLRRSVMGVANRPATAAELAEMKAKLRDAMEAGAAGLSTGLIYVPGCYAATEEVVELAKVIAPYDGIYASHIRNESEKVVESVEEVLHIGRTAGVRTNISHHKVQGRGNWGKQKITLEMIEKANAEGYHTTCDLYPYTRSMNVMRSVLPPWHYSDGIPAFVSRLADPAYRAQLKAEMTDPATPYDNFYLSAGGWDGVFIAYADANPDAPGQFMTQYAKKIGKDPFEAYFDLMVSNNSLIGGVYCTMCDEDMIEIAKSPYCVIGTDGCSRSWKHHGHPRASAAFPHAIDYFVKEKGVFTLEEMIHKMTGLTAERLLVPNKGLIRDGFDADLVILDYDNLKVHASWTEPHRKTEGIDQVIVGGETVYKDLEFTGIYSGKVIRHKKA